MATIKQGVEGVGLLLRLNGDLIFFMLGLMLALGLGSQVMLSLG